LIGYRGAKFWEVREVEILFSQVGRQIYEVREVEEFGRLGGLEELRGRNHRKHPLAGNKCIFATSCILCMLPFM
jgi:hypothetical protein